MPSPATRKMTRSHLAQINPISRSEIWERRSFRSRCYIYIINIIIISVFSGLVYIFEENIASYTNRGEDLPTDPRRMLPLEERSKALSAKIMGE